MIDFSFEAVDTLEGMRQLIADEIKTYPAPTRPSLQRKNSAGLLNPAKGEGSQSQAQPTDITEDTEQRLASLEDELKAMNVTI